MQRAYVHELQRLVLREISGPNGIHLRRYHEKLSILAKQLSRGARSSIVEIDP